jgi:hypothetical protein
MPSPCWEAWNAWAVPANAVEIVPDRGSRAMRPTVSGVEPAPNGTIMRTVFGGQLCAAVGADATRSNASAAFAPLIPECRSRASWPT